VSSVVPSPPPPPAATASRAARPGGSFLAAYRKVIWPLAALVAILLFNLAFTPGFFEVRFRNGHFDGNLINVLKNGAPVMLLSLGMTMVIATGGIDLSVGSVMAIAGAMAGVLIARPEYAALSAINVGGQLWAIIGLSLVAAVLVGVVNGLMVSVVGLQPIVATLVMMISGRGIAELITNGQRPTFDRVVVAGGAMVEPAFTFLGRGFVLALPVPFMIALGMMLVTAALTRGTALGLFLESIGNNSTASYFAGVNARVVKIVAYVWCALCAGIAGLLPTANLAYSDVNKLGLNMELDGILAAAIGGASLTGGRFSLVGSLVGAVVIQLLTTTIESRGVSSDVSMVVKAGVVVVVCLLQSDKFRALVARPFRKVAP
jgi:simple sugar transport system permease protein